jgi:hypothetical protein
VEEGVRGKVGMGGMGIERAVLNLDDAISDSSGYHSESDTINR